MTTDVADARAEDSAEHTVHLELSLEEARALKAWLLKPASDGTTALDDENITPTLLRLGTTLDYFDGVSRVRRELEHAGFSTAELTDEQIAALGRRISEAPLRPGASAE